MPGNSIPAQTVELSFADHWSGANSQLQMSAVEAFTVFHVPKSTAAHWALHTSALMQSLFSLESKTIEAATEFLLP